MKEFSGVPSDPLVSQRTWKFSGAPANPGIKIKMTPPPLPRQKVEGGYCRQASQEPTWLKEQESK